MKILVVDDDRAVREALRRALQLEGHDVAVAEDGMAALRAVATDEPAAIVLDVMMPGVDGFGVVRRLRQDGYATPVLLLTARDAVSDRVNGLDVGADDYLVKPFALDELLARLRALLRRTVTAGDDGQVRRFADLVVDVGAVGVQRGDRLVELTPTEFELLLAFVDNPGRVLTREILHERVWGNDGLTSSNTLEVYVGYLRRKLEAAGEPRLIHTVRGFGYVLRAP